MFFMKFVQLTQTIFFVRIDENSPLWEVSPIDLLTETFEIVLTMEGTTPETGNNIQVQPIMIGTFKKMQQFCIMNSKSNPGADLLCAWRDIMGLQI